MRPCLNCKKYYDKRLENCPFCGASHGEKFSSKRTGKCQKLYGPPQIRRPYTFFCLNCGSSRVISTDNPAKPYKCLSCKSNNVVATRRPISAKKEALIQKEIAKKLSENRNKNSDDNKT